jgi:hypothetical protein
VGFNFRAFGIRSFRHHFSSAIVVDFDNAQRTGGAPFDSAIDTMLHGHNLLTLVAARRCGC